MKINKIILINDVPESDTFGCEYDIDSLNKRFHPFDIKYNKIVCTDLINGFKLDADLYVIDQGGMGTGSNINYILRYIGEQVKENPSKPFLLFTTLWYLPHVWERLEEDLNEEIPNLFFANDNGMKELIKFLKVVENV